jgi:hypothetical protein
MLTAFWDVSPCSVLEVDRRFLHHQGDKIETTRCYIPEDCRQLHGRRSEKLKADILSYKCLAPGLGLGAPGVSPQGDICFEVWRPPWPVARRSNNHSRHMTTLSLFYDAVLSALFTILGEFSDT